MIQSQSVPAETSASMVEASSSITSASTRQGSNTYTTTISGEQTSSEESLNPPAPPISRSFSLLMRTRALKGKGNDIFKVVISRGSKTFKSLGDIVMYLKTSDAYEKVAVDSGMRAIRISISEFLVLYFENVRNSTEQKLMQAVLEWLEGNPFLLSCLPVITKMSPKEFKTSSAARKLEKVPEVYGPTKETVDKLSNILKTFAFSFEAPNYSVDDILNVCVVLGNHERDKVDELALPDSLFDTRSHRELLQILISVVGCLYNGEYAGRNGAHTGTLVGAKGIGKTTTLQAFTDICGSIFPEIIAVYVSCHSHGSFGNKLGSKSLYQVLIQNLVDRGFLPKSDALITSNELYRWLKKEDAKLVVLVDEFDQLYRHDNPDPNCPQRQTLHDLCDFGEQKSGRLVSFVCGSSSVLPQLVTCNAPEEIRAEFPLLKGAPNLNGQKFSTRHVYSCIPTDLDNVGRVLAIPEREQCRLFAFCVGSTARALQKVSSSLLTGESLEAIAADESMHGWKTMNGPYGDLLTSILGWMKEENKALFGQLIKDGLIDPGAIMTSDWENTFKPCPYPVVQELAGTLHKDGKVDFNRNYLTVALTSLNDKSWIVFEQKSLAQAAVYPIAMIQVAKLFLDQARIDASRKNIVDYLKESVKSAASGQAMSAYTAAARVAGVILDAGRDS